MKIFGTAQFKIHAIKASPHPAEASNTLLHMHKVWYLIAIYSNSISQSYLDAVIRLLLVRFVLLSFPLNMGM